MRRLSGGKVFPDECLSPDSPRLSEGRSSRESLLKQTHKSLKDKALVW